MFGIFKKNKKLKLEEKDSEVDKEENEEREINERIKKEVAIHVLPKKFYLQKLGVKKGGRLSLYMILGGVFVILVILGGSYFYLSSFEQKEPIVGTEVVELEEEIQKAELDLFIKGLSGEFIPREKEILIGVRLIGKTGVFLESVDFGIPNDFISVAKAPFEIKTTVPNDYINEKYVITVYGDIGGGEDLHIRKEFLVEPPVIEEEETIEVEEDTEITEIEEDESETEEAEEEVSSLEDMDEDGLSSIEEEIFGTKDNSNDSDEDSYLDKEEILNLYNPNGSGRLIDNVSIESLANKMFGYRFLSVKGWSQKSIGGDDSWLIKQSDEQFIQVVVQQNSDKQNIEDWYQEQFADEIVEESRKIESKTWTGIISEDGVSAYLTDKEMNNIFAISYNFKKDYPVYKTVFEMILKSFEILWLKLLTRLDLILVKVKY